MFRFILTIFGILFILIEVYAQQSTASKQLSTFLIHAPQLGYEKKIWLYLPKGYSKSKEKYPVIYMHDAQNLFDAKTAYAGEWGVDETLDSINAKVIIVGIEHGNEKRLEELTPFIHPKHGGGKGDAYLSFMVETLKPFVDKNYRTKISAKNTCIFGSSLGGLMSFYALLKYPKTFGKAGVFSPSFWYSNKIYEMMEASPKLKTKIFMLCGDNEDAEMVPDFEKMVTLLDRNRCYCLHLSKKKIVKNGQHNEKLWRTNFKEAYEWLF
jgi:predicted alpha/beta superfamily hydrolase